MPKSEAATIKALNSRMEEMAAQFKSEMDKFKEDFVDNLKLTEADEPNYGKLNQLHMNFLSFEKSVNDNLLTLKNEIHNLQTKIEVITLDVNKLNMSTNNNCILIHGLQEDDNNLYEKVISLVSEKLNIQINLQDINYCYRLGQIKERPKKPRPVVILFCQRWMRDKVFYSKRKLKGSKVLLSEMLTSANLSLFKQARMSMGQAVWTKNGKIYASQNNTKISITKLEDIPASSNK